MESETAATILNTESYDDRARDVKEFEDSKIGVKGLVDSGITVIPRFFIHRPDTLADLRRPSSSSAAPPHPLHLIPIVDLSGVNDSHLRSMIVEKVSRASREMGIFQIINHGIEVEFLESLLAAIRGFHEQPAEIKARLYHRDISGGLAFFSNVDIFHSKAATWRDTLQVRLGPSLPELDEIPEIFRNEVAEWNERVTKLGEVLMELLSEGLGLQKERLQELTFTQGRMMVGNYYPYCPQPDLTLGIQSHTDPGALAILAQDSIGKLQVKHNQDWVDVEYIPGALIVNIGDLLQILTNDEYKSVEHRLLANISPTARVSVVVFMHPAERDKLYGPLPELITPEKPVRFGQFSYVDYIERFRKKVLDGKTLTNYYRLSSEQD